MFPILMFSVLAVLALFAYEAAQRRWRRIRPAGPPPSESELTRWLPVMDKVLRTRD